jgi:putative nucleotide binding protein
MEENAWVLEYMPQGHAIDMRREPIVQLIGEQFFTLLEASVKQDAKINVGQKLYVGKDARTEVEKIKRRITYNELSTSAKNLLPAVLKTLIETQEKRFVDFINHARPISIRVHTLDLMPGIGKKNMETLLAEREKKPFESFQDLKARVATLGDPAAVFVHRIVSELEGKEKYFLFTRPPFQPNEGFRR